MKLVITGGSGKLARYLAPSLLNEHDVLLFDHRPPGHRQVPFVKGDIRDRDRLIEVFRGADAVIHLAALRSRYNHLPMKVMETNVLGTFSVLEAALSRGVRKLVFSSSDAVVGMARSVNELSPEYLPVDEEHPLKPQDPYGISKMLGEEMCRCYAAGNKINIIVLRFSNILCPGDEQRYLEDARDPSVRRKSLWAWVHVEDAIQAIMCALASELQGYEVFHIAAEDICLMNKDVSHLLATYFPHASVRRPLSDRESLVDCHKANRVLNFHQQVRFRKIKDIIHT